MKKVIMHAPALRIELERFGFAAVQQRSAVTHTGINSSSQNH